MSDRTKKMQGEIVPEEEVAKAFGYENVHELRKWTSDIGMQVLELKHALSIAKGDASNFKWAGMRMMVVLEKIKPFLEKLKAEGSTEVDDFILGINVVCGTGGSAGCDWDHRLKDWWKEIDARKV